MRKICSDNRDQLELALHRSCYPYDRAAPDLECLVGVASTEHLNGRLDQDSQIQVRRFRRCSPKGQVYSPRSSSIKMARSGVGPRHPSM